jgi:hypothetical protein
MLLLATWQLLKLWLSQVAAVEELTLVVEEELVDYSIMDLLMGAKLQMVLERSLLRIARIQLLSVAVV